jgi:geranylgeranyl reductase family protein
VPDIDAIIVGAGTAGCIAARTLSEAGLSVCLIDRKERKQIGEKVCGDALGEHHLKEIGLEEPNNRIIKNRIDGVRIHSPDLHTVFSVKYEDFKGYVLNRSLFGQWLLKKAEDSGVELSDYTQCLEPIIQNKRVTGVIVRNLKTNKNIRLKSKVVLDASGFSAVIRRKLPIQMGIETTIANDDVEVCYREIRQLNQEIEDTTYCDIYLNHKITPGGYTWVFPRGKSEVNVGLGVCMTEGFPKPKQQFNKYVLAKPLFKDSFKLQGGVWYDPTRRPLDKMVGNGVVILGDAASLVNPVHGGGIGPSMTSGYLAGKTIINALENGKANENALWKYNYDFMNAYGKKQASLDIFRYFLLACQNEELNYGMKHKLLTEEDVLKASLGKEFQLNISEKAKRVFKGLRRIRFLNNLRVTYNLMKQVKTHYETYPKSPDQFETWKTKTLALFQDAKARL